MAATYIGSMPGFAHLPAIELYNLLVPVGEHPAGSTVSRNTLEKYGIPVPRWSSADPKREADTNDVDLPVLQVA